jgi:hypothetical protein
VIREAVLADIPRLVEMGRQFFDASGMARFTKFDLADASKFLRSMIESESAAIFVHDEGAIGGVLTPWYSCSASLNAAEMFWWAKKNGLPLLRSFEQWAKVKGAHCVTVSSLEALEAARVGRVYARMGYEPTERTYVKVL